MKKIMVLAGGSDQKYLIEKLRVFFPDSEIILIDMATKVIATQAADRHLVISTMDRDAVTQAAREEKVDMIITACGDQPLTTMAYVSEQLNLPCYLTFEQSVNLTNKLFMKKLMVEAGIPTAKHRLIDLNDNFDISDLSYPLIIKPVDNNGSKGITKVLDPSELEAAVKIAQQYSISGNTIVEEFKIGEEYSVEAIIRDGRGELVIVTKNIKRREDTSKFTIVQNYYVNDASELLKERILEVINRIASTFKLVNAPLLIQMIVDDNNEINVIEFSARTGGGSKVHFIRELAGVDVVENLIDITIGNRPTVKVQSKKCFATINFVYCNSCTFNGIENIETLKERGIVYDYYYYKPLGTKITKAEYSADRPAGFFVIGDTLEQMNSRIIEIDNSIKILDENSSDSMIHGLYVN